MQRMVQARARIAIPPPPPERAFWCRLKLAPESAAMLANVKRAMAITANLNRLTFNDADEVRALFSDLIGKKVDDSFLLIPPFYATGGADISVGRNVFVNQNCTFYDLGGLDIADDVPAPIWVCLTKATDYRLQIGKVPRRRYSNDPRHGTPCTCADGGFCRGVDAGHVPWRKQQSVADQ